MPAEQLGISEACLKRVYQGRAAESEQTSA